MLTRAQNRFRQSRGDRNPGVPVSCPDIFEMHDDGLAYVKEAHWPTMYGPDGSPKGEPVYQMAGGMAGVPEEYLDATIESAEECPGECIYIEVE